MKVSLRGKLRGRSRSLAELQEKLAKANGIKRQPAKVVARGGLIFGKLEPSGEEPFQQSALPNPVWLGGISIRYYTPGEMPEMRISTQ
jgi:hypothetical protein